jgi:hypothetical protein
VIELRAFINEDNTKVRLVFPQFSDMDVTLTAEELDRYIEILIEIREQMQPPLHFYNAPPPN